jgi:DNA-directed RNA polymerase
MTHHVEIDRLGEQMQLERLLHEEAIFKLQAKTETAIESKYYSSTVQGVALVRTALDAVSTVMRNRWKTVSCKPGPDHAEITALLRGANFDTLALIGLRVLLDQLMIRGTKTEYVGYCMSIGGAIQKELRMEFYKEEAPELYRAIAKSRFHKGSGAHYKVHSMTNAMMRESIVWKSWPSTSLYRIGAWVLGAIEQATSWVEVETVVLSPKKKLNTLRIKPVFTRLVAEVTEKAEGMAFLRRPMLTAPLDWHMGEDGKYHGGYLDNEVCEWKLVRTHGPSGDPGPVALAAINRLQQVAYKINQNVLKVAQWARDHRIGQIGSGSEGGAFFYGEAQDMPGDYENPEDIDGFKAWKRMKKDIYDRNAVVTRENVRTYEIVREAERFSYDTFYIPWQFDYRGRMYPMTTVLNPQGIDFEKAMFYFAEEGPADESWLAFQVATTYGLDKATMAERIAWARENTDLISEIAQDPIDSIPRWETAGEPWSFMAACCEYYACCIARTKATSGLPVGIDATCSGLQHLSSMTLDATAAALVNVTPSATVADGYKAVAEAAKPHVPEHVRDWLTRKVTKRTVMTVPYGVSRHGSRGYIREQLMEDGRDLKEEGLLSTITSAVYDKGMREVFLGPIGVMQWIKKAALEAGKRGDDLRWSSPSGFEVVQMKREPLTKRIESQLFGGVRIQSSICLGNGETDPHGHSTSAAPNLVHSCDAALMHFTMSDTDCPMWGIHDCLLGRSCDIDELAYKVRLHFCEMYRGTNILADWARDVGVEPNDALIVGDLDVESVMDSAYFFS